MLHDPAFPQPCVDAREIFAHFHKETWTGIPTAIGLETQEKKKKSNQTKYPLTGQERSESVALTP